MKILGIHFNSHDTGAALVVDGGLVSMMEEERFDHQKHTNAFPVNSISACLKMGGVGWRDVDCVAYANSAKLSNFFKKIFISKSFSDFKPNIYSQNYIEKILHKELTKYFGDVNPNFFYTDHHTAHAASVFYLSPYEESAIFTVDGMGNWVTTTLGIGIKNKIKTLSRIGHPHSLGLFYGALTQYIGFKANCDEGKTMGLAPYGKPKYVNFFRKICRVQEGTIELELSYFKFHKDTLLDPEGNARQWYSERMVNVLGPVREPESELTEHAADVACSVQKVYEEGCYKLLEHLYNKTNNKNVCLSGGGVLNCTMNGKISSNTNFDNIFVMPAANDAGLCIGAALVAEQRFSPKNFKRKSLRHAYYGSEYSEVEIGRALNGVFGDPAFQISRPENLENDVAVKLASFEIVGWYQGRMEFGPRSLGHRSILANPTREDSKDRVNNKVKFRENFRPFAPIIPLEEACNYFEIDGESPYMLKITPVKKNKQAFIPAVTHIDGSARVQTVTRCQNKKIYDLLYAIKKHNGIPVLLNTSFNIRGDTIVRTPNDALKCFMNTGMDSLAIGPYLISKISKQRSNEK